MHRKAIAGIKKTIDKMGPGLRGFIIRSLIFALLICLILPFIAKIFVSLFGGALNYTINYLYIELIYLGIIFIFLLYSRHKIRSMEAYKQSWRQTILFGYIGLIFYALKVFIKSFVNTLFLSGSIYLVVLLEYLFTIIAAGFIALAIFNLTAFRRFYKEITISIVVSFCFFLFAMFLRSTWGYFSSVVGNVATLLLRLTMPGADIYFRDFTIGINGFSAAIGPACSGIESMAMFTSIFLLLVIYDFNDVNKRKIAPFFIFGLIGMYAMTIIRIYLLFLVGTFNPELAMSLFHTNLGWVLFVVYMFLFLYFAYPRMLEGSKFNQKV